MDTAAILQMKSNAETYHGQGQRLVVHGWVLRLVLDSGTWKLSARLHPYGRSSSENDWVTLGRITSALGAPRAPAENLDDVHPNEPLHWTWSDGKTKPDAAPSVPSGRSQPARNAHGPVTELPKDWSWERWENLTNQNEPGVKYRRKDGLLVIVQDTAYGSHPVRHVSVSSKTGAVSDEDAATVKRLFFQDGAEISDATAPSGVLHMILKKPNPDAVVQ